LLPFFLDGSANVNVGGGGGEGGSGVRVCVRDVDSRVFKVGMTAYVSVGGASVHVTFISLSFWVAP
jgi:hypothetical protein